MHKRRSVTRNFLVWFLLFGTPLSFAQSTAKRKVNSQGDLPRFTYPVQGSASELVQADEATFDVFAKKIQSDLDTIFRDYEIEDKSTMRALLSAKLDLQVVPTKNSILTETISSEHPGSPNLLMGFRPALGKGIVLNANKSLHSESLTSGSSHRSISIEWY
jgi:hypothetical protein